MQHRGLIFAFVITFCLVFGVFSNALAQYNLSLQLTSDGSAEATEFARGDDLYLNIILDNAGGVAGCAFSLEYETDVLTAPATNADGTPLSAGEITSLFPFTYNSTATHRENSSEPGKIYFSGAEIDTIDGDAKYESGEIVLFTVKFKVKSDAPFVLSDLTLYQTELFNLKAGYGTDNDGSETYTAGDLKDKVPVLVGAVADGQPGFDNFNCFNPPCAFPILLQGNTNPSDPPLLLAGTGFHVVEQSVDNDGDGIDDNWEMTHFQNLTTADATSDYDKDGYSDEQEYLNGSPYDPKVQDNADGPGYNRLTDIRVAPWVPIEGNQYNMVVYGPTAYDGEDFAAVDDWIGAFGPGGDTDCRAVGQVTANGDYYLTVRGNTNGDTITFKLRRSSDLEILDALETVQFQSDTTEAGKDLHFGVCTLSLNLIQGWNWVSFNVLPEDTSLDGFFGAHSGDIEQIKTQTTSATNVPGSGWMGDDLGLLSNIANGAMFKIKATAGFTLDVTGLPVAPDTAITLQQGWSWVAYLPDTCVSVENAMGSIIENLAQVKSQTQSKTKIGADLIGDLFEMCSGQGYTINMSAAGTLTYPNP